MSAVAAETALRSVLVIEGSEELAAIENEVRAFAAPLGYDRFVLFSVSAAQDAVLQSIYRVEDEWFGDGESVDAETYIRRCPVTRHILEAHEPFFWTKTVILLLSHQLGFSAGPNLGPLRTAAQANSALECQSLH
jgi:hypothetical protein